MLSYGGCTPAVDKAESSWSHWEQRLASGQPEGPCRSPADSWALLPRESLGCAGQLGSLSFVACQDLHSGAGQCPRAELFPVLPATAFSLFPSTSACSSFSKDFPPHRKKARHLRICSPSCLPLTWEPLVSDREHGL